MPPHRTPIFENNLHIPITMQDLTNKPTANLNIADAEEDSALSLDAVFSALRRFWFLIILCALAGGTGAYYFAGKQSYVYKKSASVMMRDMKDKSAASSDRILNELGVDTGAVSLANESFILKSTALMQRVVEKLGLNTSYWTRQELRLIDLYGVNPILVHFTNVLPQIYCSLGITMKSETEFSLIYRNREGLPVQVDGICGSPIQLPFATIDVHPTAHYDESWIGREVTVNYQPELEEARALLNALTVTRPDEKEASLLELNITSSSPLKAEEVLDTLITVYNQQSKEEKSESARKTEIFIHNRLAEIGRTLENVDRQIADTKSGVDVVQDTQTTISADFTATRELSSAIFNLQTRIKIAATLAENMEEAGNNGALITVESGDVDAALSSTIGTYNEACLEYKRISGSAGARNPIVVAHREQMSVALTAAKRALKNYRANLDLELKQLEQKKADMEARMEKLAAKERELTPLIREHKVREELYMLLLTKEQENALALAIAAPGARLLESAHGSNAPIAPRTQVFVAAGVAGGGAACLLLILGIGMLNNKVKNRHDVTANSSLPVLAELPELSRRERRNKGLFIKDAHSTMAEGLHILRNNVDNFLPRPDGCGHIILLTSSMPNEGKTFVASNLAATFAQTGRKVLLIDADLRKVSLTRDLGGKGRAGLTSYLLHRESDLCKLIHNLPQAVPAAKNEETARKHDGRADILYAGPTVPHPITLLAQPLLGEMLKTLAKQYDAIIVDAPPCGILADTDILAAQCDITLYIVRSGLIDKRYLQQVQKMADQGKLPHVAYVINAVDFKASSYNYYGYTYGHYRYGYGNK